MLCVSAFLNRVFDTYCVHFGTDRDHQGLERKPQIRLTQGGWSCHTSRPARSVRCKKSCFEFSVAAPLFSTSCNQLSTHENNQGLARQLYARRIECSLVRFAPSPLRPLRSKIRALKNEVQRPRRNPLLLGPRSLSLRTAVHAHHRYHTTELF